MEKYDIFALTEYVISPEDVASMEEAAAASNQLEAQRGVPSSGSTPTGAKRSRSSTSKV